MGPQRGRVEGVDEHHVVLGKGGNDAIGSGLGGPSTDGAEGGEVVVAIIVEVHGQHGRAPRRHGGQQNVQPRANLQGSGASGRRNWAGAELQGANVKAVAAKLSTHSADAAAEMGWGRIYLADRLLLHIFIVYANHDPCGSVIAHRRE